MKDMKFDQGKPRMIMALQQFSLSIAEIDKVVRFGAEKYELNSWRGVSDGQKRYAEALVRHALCEGVDAESGLLHAAHAAWNALAVLEFELVKKARL